MNRWIQTLCRAACASALVSGMSACLGDTGAQGSQGLTGATGATGATRPQGAQGP